MIEIDGTYFVTPDTYGYQLGVMKQAKDKKTGEMTDVFIPQSYHATLGHALKRYRDIVVAKKLSDGTYNVKDIIDVIQEADREWDELKERLGV